MYRLSRLLLIVGVIALFYCSLVIASIVWPAAGWLVVSAAAAYGLRQRAPPLTTLGSARWASEDELRDAGMIGGNEGLIIGWLPPSNRPWEGLKKLFSRRINSQEICTELWFRRVRRRGHLVRLANAIHIAVFGPSGAGKGVSCILPFLLSSPDSCVVVDFKGENFLKTAKHRATKFGHRIIVLDPFKMVTQTPDSFNALDVIDPDSPNVLDDCNSLAKAIVVRTGNERDPHWAEVAEEWLAAIIAVVVFYGRKENESRSLQTVHEFFSNPERLTMAVQLMRESDYCEGKLKDLGGQLLHFVDKEKQSTLTSVGTHLRFLATPAIAASTRASSFDPSELRSNKATIYLVLPPEYMRAQAGLLRLWIGSLLKSVIKGGLQE